MGALHNVVFENMQKELEHKKELMVRTIPPLDMTHQELMELICPPEHIEILTKAAEYANVTSSGSRMVIPVPGDIDGSVEQKVYLFMCTHGEKNPPLTPKYPYWQPGKSGHKIIAWLNKRYEIGRRFAMASFTLKWLNEECDTGAQMRFMWPVILHLCKPHMEYTEPRMDAWREKHAAHKVCKYLPVVPPAVKITLQDSLALLTSSVMIGDDIPIPDAGPVQIAMYCNPVFRVGESWLYRM